jgi:ADP-heptose:LPS heptosyltransferase
LAFPGTRIFALPEPAHLHPISADSINIGVMNRDPAVESTQPVARPGNQPARKVLLVSLAGIGDTLLATPLLRALRTHLPEARIDALVMWAGSKELLEGNPCVDAVYQKNLLRDGALSSLPWLCRLRRERYDLSINTYPQGRRIYRLTSRLIAARERLSHAYENHGWADRLLVSRTLPQDYTLHCVENNLRLLRLLDLDVDPAGYDCELFFSRAEEQWAEAFFRQHRLEQRRLVAVHVGSGRTKNLILKRWPLAHYADLLRALLAQRREVTALLFGGPEEQADNAQLLGQVNSPHLVAVSSRTTKEAAALLRRCHVFLSVDNFFMHLAAAVKVPRQIVIESPTFNKTIQPYKRPFRLVSNPIVAGRNLDYYRYDGRDIQGGTKHLLECMRSITPEAMLQALELELAGVRL